MLIDFSEPCRSALTLPNAQRFPKHIGGQQERVCDGSHLDELLVVVATIAPIGTRLRIGTRNEPIAIDALESPAGTLGAACPIRGQDPQRPRPCLHGNDLVLVLRSATSKIEQRLAVAIVRQQRIQIVKKYLRKCFSIHPSILLGQARP